MLLTTEPSPQPEPSKLKRDPALQNRDGLVGGAGALALSMLQGEASMRCEFYPWLSVLGLFHHFRSAAHHGGHHCYLHLCVSLSFSQPGLPARLSMEGWLSAGGRQSMVRLPLGILFHREPVSAFVRRNVAVYYVS